MKNGGNHVGMLGEFQMSYTDELQIYYMLNNNKVLAVCKSTWWGQPQSWCAATQEM